MAFMTLLWFSECFIYILVFLEEDKKSQSWLNISLINVEDARYGTSVVYVIQERRFFCVGFLVSYNLRDDQLNLN